MDIVWEPTGERSERKMLARRIPVARRRVAWGDELSAAVRKELRDSSRGAQRMRGRGRGKMKRPPRRSYSACWRRISSAKFQAKITQ